MSTFPRLSTPGEAEAHDIARVAAEVALVRLLAAQEIDGLAAALEAIAAEGDAARETALAHLERLGSRP